MWPASRLRPSAKCGEPADGGAGRWPAGGNAGTGLPWPGTTPGPFSPARGGEAKRFHGTAILDATRVGRDASRIADEVISHLAGLVGASVTVTIEVEAEIPDGAPDQCGAHGDREQPDVEVYESGV
jgi:hypothetical protein